MADPWPSLFLPHWFEASEASNASEALRFEGASWDYAELRARVTASRLALRSAGVQPGDRVAILAPPSAEGVALIHAMLDAGLVMVPLNLRLSAVELEAATKVSKARFLVVSRETLDLGRGLRTESGVGLIQLRPEGLVLEAAPSVAPAAEESGPNDAGWGDRAAMREAGAALVLLTSGTSGQPKAALLSLGNLLASAEASAALLGAGSSRRTAEGPPDRWLLAMPLFHIGGLSILIRSALAGTSVLLHPGFDAAAVAHSLENEGVTQASFVATMLARVLEARGDQRCPDALRLVLLGGGAAPQSLLERAGALGYPVAPTYGLTEAASQVATRPPGDAGRMDGLQDLSAGLRPLPGVALQVVNESGDAVSPGVVGEIEVKGPTLMLGYLGDAAATAQVFRKGWLRTGDLGELDASGGLRVVDRRSDLIVSGGENIYPAEIESVLSDHPAVLEVGVVGRPDAEFGARPIAFVVRRGERDASGRGGREAGDEEMGAALIDYCRSRLAGFKVPAEIRWVAGLPRTASGKLLRRSLLDVD